jgi:hypothetical protein
MAVSRGSPLTLTNGNGQARETLRTVDISGADKEAVEQVWKPPRVAKPSDLQDIGPAMGIGHEVQTDAYPHVRARRSSR